MARRTPGHPGFPGGGVLTGSGYSIAAGKGSDAKSDPIPGASGQGRSKVAAKPPGHGIFAAFCRKPRRCAAGVAADGNPPPFFLCRWRRFLQTVTSARKGSICELAQ